ncbi:MAG: PqqD family protein [Prevotella sp.]
MKKKPGFTLRSLCGEQFLIAEGYENIDFTNLIAVNQTAAYIWNSIDEDTEFTEEDITRLLLSEYEVSEEEARKDAHALLKKMLSAEVVVE